MLGSIRRITQSLSTQQIRLMSKGKGKGGAGGKSGAAPEAEGNVDKVKAAREEEFFHKQKNEQLKKLKTKKEPKKPKGTEENKK
uniref:Uncharacterized protein n=1 Tax=Stomoxys calcitrans TaxID=35570 RepID=A0A1I8Q8A6_STOCA